MNRAINKHVALFPSPAQTGPSAVLHVAVEPRAVLNHARMETGVTHAVQYPRKRIMKRVMCNNVMLLVLLLMRNVPTLVTVLKRVEQELNIALENARLDNGVIQVVHLNSSIDTSHAMREPVAQHFKNVQTLVLVVHLVVVE